ncbi:MAG: NAD(P)H-binding protein [Verrucomicrobiales bacterium]|nr:NAD(P)H-binding protein [Verrucomicrobiales bacterium]
MQDSTSILVFGGTGHLGRDVVHALLRTGASLRVASRRTRPVASDSRIGWTETDLLTGRGVAESVRGVRTILFCAGSPKQHAAVEIEGMRRLLTEAQEQGVAHFVFVSIVGIDHLPVPYYRTKLAAERLIRESGVPFTILRATQFHYFVDLLLSALARAPFVLPLPKGFRVQPVATEDVANRLVRCLADGPRGLLKDFCGPELFSMPEAAALWNQVRGLRKRVLQIPIPGRLGAAFREGHNTNPAGELGVLRWSDWLAREYPTRQE